MAGLDGGLHLIVPISMSGIPSQPPLGRHPICTGSSRFRSGSLAGLVPVRLRVPLDRSKWERDLVQKKRC